jgi:hypothetical protein
MIRLSFAATFSGCNVIVIYGMSTLGVPFRKKKFGGNHLQSGHLKSLSLVPWHKTSTLSMLLIYLLTSCGISRWAQALLRLAMSKQPTYISSILGEDGTTIDGVSPCTLPRSFTNGCTFVRLIALNAWILLLQVLSCSTIPM